VALSSFTVLAGERTIRLASWIERDWPRTLLNYDFAFKAGEFAEGRLEVADSAGRPVEAQTAVTARHADGSIQSCRISFYSDLKKGETRQWTLKSADAPAAVAPRAQATLKDGALEVSSESAGVRIPAPGGKAYDTPVEPAAVPAPILGWRLASGIWAGKGWLEGDRKVAAWSQRVVADGPLYKEYEYNARFAPEGVYTVRVRVEAELPLVHVAEEYDMGGATAGRDFLVLQLNDGWTADTAMFAADRLPAGRQKRLRDRRVEHDSCVWQEAIELDKDREHSRLYCWGDWGPKALWYVIYGDGGDAASPCVGVMSEHVGAWRLPNQSVSSFWWMQDGRVLAKLRTSINLNGAPQNPFSTEEIDPALPQTLGRRLWSLVLGPRPMAAKTTTVKDGKETDVEAPVYATMDLYRSYYSFITLDDYKDWVLEWPEDPKLEHPRAVLTGAQLASLRKNLDRWPGREPLKGTFLVSGDPKAAVREAESAIASLDSRFAQALPYFLTHYRQTQFDYGAIFPAESALACRELPADLRTRLRAKLAAICHMLTTPDFNPRGAGVHMGNPNMAVNRYMGLPVYATLIQDHPRARAWLDDAAVYTKWKASYNITSGGGTFRENPGYATYGPSIFLGTAAIALRNAGYDLDRFENLKDLGRYFRDIDTPVTAPRGVWRKDHIEWLAGRKVRVLPGFGNGADVAGGQTELLLANLTATSDPAYAAERLAVWEECGAYFGTEQVYPGFWFYWNPDLKPVKPQRRDAVLAGFGGVLRAHADSPEETCAMLRQGYTQSHWNPDQGTFVLYARGACLCPPTGWGYSGTAGICHDSRICFGEPLADHEHGRVDTNIEDYGSTPAVGYLLGRQTFLKRWDRTKTLPGNFDWSRQVMMLRSARPDGANYIVVRDSTQGECPLPSWWYQWLVAKAENVRPVAGGVRADCLDGVKLDVVFADPADAQVSVKGTRVQGFQEDYSQLCVNQPAGRGYTTVFYPSRGAEAGVGKVEALADGVVRVTTPESVDYVFCAVGKPVVFRNDEVEIAAQAGAVRVFPDKVLLVNASGIAGRVGYKGAVAEGVGPFEESLTPGGKAKTVRTGRELARVEEPKGGGALYTFDGRTPVAPDAAATADGLTGWVRVEGERQTFVAAAGNGVLRCGDFYVKGEAPFTCVREPGKITLRAEGRRRIFQMPIPENIVPAKLLPPKDSLPEDFKQNWSVGGWINWPWAVDVKVDGTSVQGGWYDGLMAVGLDDGRHEAVITPYTNPPVWPENAWTRRLP